jgi:hypothetical protein
MALINVPNPGQTLGNSRPSINSNFAVIDAAFIVDHEDYNTTNQGMHNRVSFLSQNPVPVPQAGIVQLYSQISTITNQPELVFTHQAGSTAPIAILLKWHAGINFTSLSTVTVNLNVDVAGSPNFTNVFAVFPSTTESSANYNTVIGIQSIVGPSVIFSIFGAVRPPAGTTIAYLAIGM